MPAPALVKPSVGHCSVHLMATSPTRHGSKLSSNQMIATETGEVIPLALVKRSSGQRLSTTMAMARPSGPSFPSRWEWNSSRNPADMVHMRYHSWIVEMWRGKAHHFKQILHHHFSHDHHPKHYQPPSAPIITNRNHSFHRPVMMIIQ